MDLEKIVKWCEDEQMCSLNEMTAGLHTCDEKIMNYLQLCAANGYDDKLKHFIYHVNDDNVVTILLNSENGEGWTAAMQAARHGQTSTLNIILNYCKDINVRSKLSGTVLLCACRSGHLSSVKLVLDRGALICHFDEVTPLMVASQYGYDAIVKELLDRGCDVDFKSKSAGLTALMLAVSNCHMTTVKMLLQKGADVRVTNKAGMSALDIAELRRKKTLQSLLIRSLKKTQENDDETDVVPADDVTNELKTFSLLSIPSSTADNKWLKTRRNEKWPWWNCIFKYPKKNRNLKCSGTGRMVFSASALKNINISKSADCVNAPFIIPTPSPCRISNVKQVLQSQIDALLSPFQTGDPLPQMPPGKTISYSKESFPILSIRQCHPPKDHLYEELKRFSLEDCYHILLKEELDLESLALLTEKDLDNTGIEDQAHREKLLALIDHLKRENNS